MTRAVIDASTLVDALLPGSENDAVRAALAGLTELVGPEHLRAEVLSVLRRLDRVTASPALVRARQVLVELDITSVPLTEVHERVWELRHTLTVHDAAYAAVAEFLRVPLLTSDQAFRKSPDIRCAVDDPRED